MIASINFKLVFKHVGSLLVVLGIALIAPSLVSAMYGESVFRVFLGTSLLAFVLGGGLHFVLRKAEGSLKKRGALLLVPLTWFSMTLIGAIPFYSIEAFPSFIDALFESASGFTTTGATVLSDVESLPRGVLVWRSISQYIGGMGIIVLSLAVLPLIGVGGMDLYQAEAPGPKSDKISSRVRETARALWVFYVLFALLAAGVYFLLGMDLFDAINHGLTTVATGGFSTKNTSILAFQSNAIEWAATIFMVLAGSSFILHYRLFVRGKLDIVRDREFRFYCLIIIFSTFALTFWLWMKGFFEADVSLRMAAFQVASILSSTGFGTGNYDAWGSFAQVLMIVLMVIGGCAGSTAGGIKCVRAMLLIKQGAKELQKLIHPHAVIVLKLGKSSVSAKVTSAIFGFFFLYACVLTVSTLLLCVFGVELTTAISACISCLSNIGPGLSQVGPTLNYGDLPAIVKLILSFCMIVGRLEIMTVLVVFSKYFWQR